jgi:hypothetical protein
MDRRLITADVVQEADLLLTFGLDPATIADRLGITEYVVRLMATDPGRRRRRQPRQFSRHRVPNPCYWLDPTTIRMIRRMLDVGILHHGQIAREAGVSRSVVEKIANGERLALGVSKILVFDDLGERCLDQSIRCSGCGATISIVPCRTCRAQQSLAERRMREAACGIGG